MSLHPRHRRPLVLAAATLAFTVAAGIASAKTCYDFDRQLPGTSYAVDAALPIEIGIGQVFVRELKLDGVVQGPNNRFFKVAEGQHIAGGAAAPEMYGKNVAVQMVPAERVRSITLKYSHQPGPEGGRAAMVEVNGVRRDWRGSFGKLDGRELGAAHSARFAVRQPESVDRTGWVSGELKVTSRAGIRSFTLGAAELRLDDICFER